MWTYFGLGLLLWLLVAGQQGSSVPRNFTPLAGTSGLASKTPQGQSDSILNRLFEARQAVQKNPASAEAYVSLGLALEAIPDTQAASEAFDRAIAVDARSAQAWYQKGIIATQQSLWHVAAQDFRRALAVLPDDPLGHLELGEMLLRMGDFEAAST